MTRFGIVKNPSRRARARRSSEKHARLDRRGTKTHLGGSGQALEEIPRSKEGSREISKSREIVTTFRRVPMGEPE